MFLNVRRREGSLSPRGPGSLLTLPSSLHLLTGQAPDSAHLAAGPTGSVCEGSARHPAPSAIQGSLPRSLCSVLPLRFGRKRLQWMFGAGLRIWNVLRVLILHFWAALHKLRSLWGKSRPCGAFPEAPSPPVLLPGSEILSPCGLTPASS